MKRPLLYSLLVLVLRVIEGSNMWTPLTTNLGVQEPPPDRHPHARHGHASVVFYHPELEYNISLVFGGVSREGKYLNDLWIFNLTDEMWYQVSFPYDYPKWTTDQDSPAGRMGHAVALYEPELILSLHGGLAPNCSDYCPDYWNYNISGNTWYRLYGEWWGLFQVWEKMFDYAAYAEALPHKRWRHAMVNLNDKIVVFGGHNGQHGALNDVWTAKINIYEPFVGNLALQGTARQSSQVGPDWDTDHFGAAKIGFPAAAHDNNFNGDFFKGSVTLTRNDPQAWWQMTLGSKKFIENVTVYNRRDCCKDKLSNFYILLSKTIFSSARLQVVLAEARVLKYHFMYVVGISTAFVVKRNAVYVRVQLAGTNQLSLTEIWGYKHVEEDEHFKGPRKWSNILPPLPIPQPRFGHAALVHKGELWVSGGYTNTNPYYLNDMWVFNLEKEQWKIVEDLDPAHVVFIQSLFKVHPDSPMPHGRFGHGMLYIPDEYGDIIFLFGGRATPRVLEGSTDYAFEDNKGYLDDLWQFNLSCKRWTKQLTANPWNVTYMGRYAFSNFYYKDAVYVYGGFSSQCPNNVCADNWKLNITGIIGEKAQKSWLRGGKMYIGDWSCPNDCLGVGSCSFGWCVCNWGRRGYDCSNVTCPTSPCIYDYVQHVENCFDCSGHGECLAVNGTCACQDGWLAEDCSLELFQCGDCSGHGFCLPANFTENRPESVCSCEKGYIGRHCETQVGGTGTGPAGAGRRRIGQIGSNQSGVMDKSVAFIQRPINLACKVLALLICMLFH